MPLKNNNGGQLQEYIGKGNGEKSGQYTYNSYDPNEIYYLFQSKKYYDNEYDYISNHKKELDYLIYLLEKTNTPNILEIIYNFNIPRGYNGIKFLKELTDTENREELLNLLKQYTLSFDTGQQINNIKFLSNIKNDIITNDEHYYYGTKMIIGSHTLEEDVSVVNRVKYFDGDRESNCVNCVIAMWARRELGIDVIAKPYEKDILFSDLKKFFKDIDPIEYSGKNKHIMQDAIHYISLLSQYDSKYFCAFETDDTSHAIYIESNNRTIRIIDPQKGTEISIKEFETIPAYRCRIVRLNGKAITKKGRDCFMRRNNND